MTMRLHENCPMLDVYIYHNNSKDLNWHKLEEKMMAQVICFHNY